MIDTVWERVIQGINLQGEHETCRILVSKGTDTYWVEVFQKGELMDRSWFVSRDEAMGHGIHFSIEIKRLYRERALRMKI